jgi:hypothetical protein
VTAGHVGSGPAMREVSACCTDQADDRVKSVGRPAWITRRSPVVAVVAGVHVRMAGDGAGDRMSMQTTLHHDKLKCQVSGPSLAPARYVAGEA